MKAIVVFDIDGVIRDVSGSYRRALADTVEHFTAGAFRPSQAEIDALKTEGIWNNDWEASQEFIYRYAESQGKERSQLSLAYEEIVAFFQQRYRGEDPTHPAQWNGYITTEPLLVSADYFTPLTTAGIGWGFFSGATRGSATYVLERRLKLTAPVLVAMEDAPGKPDPTGLFQVVQQLQAQTPSESDHPANHPVIYAGDTVADIQTVEQARSIAPDRHWIGVGILPPHAQTTSDYANTYASRLQQAGATLVLNSIRELTVDRLRSLLEDDC